jgi:uncharacterized protein
MFQFFRLAMALGFAPIAATLTACTSVAELVVERPDVAIGTGMASGAYYPLGGSICRLFNRDMAGRGLRCAAELSAGPVANIESLRSRRIDIGIVQSDVLADAVAGQGTFTAHRPNTELRVLFTGHAEAFTVVARRELGIRTALELRGKRINMGSPGSGERVSMERVMTALGFSKEDFVNVHELPLAAQHDAFCAHEIDAIVYSVGHPNGLIEDLTRLCEGILLDVSGPRIDGLLSGRPEYERALIPGRMYSSNPTDMRTLGVRAEIVATTLLSDALGYAIAKAVFENFDDFRRLNPAFATLAVTDLIPDGSHTSVHAGAARYFRERGWRP